jgi:hypothetical protein
MLVVQLSHMYATLPGFDDPCQDDPLCNQSLPDVIHLGDLYTIGDLSHVERFRVRGYWYLCCWLFNQDVGSTLVYYRPQFRKIWAKHLKSVSDPRIQVDNWNYLCQKRSKFVGKLMLFYLQCVDQMLFYCQSPKLTPSFKIFLIHWVDISLRDWVVLHQNAPIALCNGSRTDVCNRSKLPSLTVVR